MEKLKTIIIPDNDPNYENFTSELKAIKRHFSEYKTVSVLDRASGKIFKYDCIIGMHETESRYNLIREHNNHISIYGLQKGQDDITRIVNTYFK